MNRWIELIFLAPLLAAPARAFSDAPREPERLSIVEGISEDRLPNGMRVLLFPEPATPSITLTITYLAGSKWEGYGETGVAHVLEHLLFRQTTSGRDIQKELSARGARSNGTTTADRTNYSETFRASAGNLEWALGMEADRMRNIKIGKAALDSVLAVIRDEINSALNDPFRVLFQRALGVAYTFHPYGKPAWGNPERLDRISVDSVKRFYDAHYRPDRAVLMLAGQFEATNALGLAMREFGSLPAGLPETELSMKEPPQDGERTVQLRGVGPGSSLIALYHTPAATHADTGPLNVLAEVLRERLGRATTGGEDAVKVSGGQKDLHDCGYLWMGLQTNRERPALDLRQAMLKTFDAAAAGRFAKDELESAKTRLLRLFDTALTNPETIGRVMSEYASLGDWKLFFYERDELRKVTDVDVERVAAKYLRPVNRTVGEFVPAAMPDRVEIPEAPRAADLVRNFRGSPTLADGEVFAPTPANIEARISRWHLGNGMKVALLRKMTRGRIVTAQLNARFGASASIPGQAVAGQLAASLLLRGGPGRPGQEIQKELTRLRARVNVSGSADAVTVLIESAAEDFEAVLGLVAELLREATFPTAEFEAARGQRIAALEGLRNDPMALARITLEQRLHDYPAGAARRAQTLNEQIAAFRAITVEDLRRFHRQCFGGGDSEFVVVGPLQASALKTLSTQLFADWRSPAGRVRSVKPRAIAGASDQAIETPGKTGAVLVAGLTGQIRDDDADYPALLMANMILGGRGTSRLGRRLRENEGLCYSVGTALVVSPEEPEFTFTSMMTSSADNIPRVQRQFTDELNRIARDGFTVEEVAAAKAGWQEEQIAARAQNRALAALIAVRERSGRTLMWDETLDRRVLALTPDEVSAAFRRHIVSGALSIVKAGAFQDANRPK